MELFKNKILIALYSIWVSIHFYLFLIGGGGIKGSGYYYNGIESETTYYAKDYFYPFEENGYTYFFEFEFYDVSELFVYSVLPILLVLLFIALFKRK